MQIRGRRYDNSQRVVVTIERGCIAQVEPETGTAASADACPWISPAFFDIQINGYGGQEFSSLELTPEKVEQIVRDHYRFGVTRVCPTLTTESIEVLTHGMRTIAAACDASPQIARSVCGIHLEGPYLSAQDGPRGAHPAQHCKPPELDEFRRLQDAAGGRIVILTMSPEYDGAPSFISEVAGSGVVVAIGHTAADSVQIRAAVDAGARLSTHLGNGAHRVLRRHPNYIWDQMADDRLMASLIVDGHHLPPEVVKSIVRAKDPSRCILVSDISGLAGLPPGRYQSSGCELEILSDGRLVIAGQDQLLAGASLPIGTGIANVMRFAGVDLETAVQMASAHPAQLLGQADGALRPGDAADLVLFDLVEDSSTHEPTGLEIRATICGGEVAFGAIS